MCPFCRAYCKKVVFEISLTAPDVLEEELMAGILLTTSGHARGIKYTRAGVCVFVSMSVCVCVGVFVAMSVCVWV